MVLLSCICFFPKVAENEQSIRALVSKKAKLQEEWNNLQQQIRKIEDNMAEIDGHTKIKLKDLDQKRSLLKNSKEILASVSNSVEKIRLTEEICGEFFPGYISI